MGHGEQRSSDKTTSVNSRKILFFCIVSKRGIIIIISRRLLKTISPQQSQMTSRETGYNMALFAALKASNSSPWSLGRVLKIGGRGRLAGEEVEGRLGCEREVVEGGLGQPTRVGVDQLGGCDG